MMYEFSVKKGDLQFIRGHWYVTHTGLVGLSSRRNCRELHTGPIVIFCDPTSPRWDSRPLSTIAKVQGNCYGVADPFNVSFLVHGAEMRVAETRAVNRALRKAWHRHLLGGFWVAGLCSPPRLQTAHRRMLSSIWLMVNYSGSFSL